MKKERSLTVHRIKQESDRVLLYAECLDYHVIAPFDLEVQVGDTIIYEPYGINFGWFIRKEETP